MDNQDFTKYYIYATKQDSKTRVPVLPLGRMARRDGSIDDKFACNKDKMATTVAYLHKHGHDIVTVSSKKPSRAHYIPHCTNGNAIILDHYEAMDRAEKFSERIPELCGTSSR